MLNSSSIWPSRVFGFSQVDCYFNLFLYSICTAHIQKTILLESLDICLEVIETLGANTYVQFQCIIYLILK